MSITENGVLQKDDNGYPVMGGTSNADDATIINSAFDPVTRRLLVDLPTGSSVSFLTATGTVDGSNTAFTFTTAPKIIFVDQGRAMQKTSSDGTVNWTGTTSVTLTIAPTFDIYALG